MTCEGARRHHIVYGWASDLPSATEPSFAVRGSLCDIGVTSAFTWRDTPDPAEDLSNLLWWLMIAQDGSGTEGSWGKDAAGLERVGPGASGSSGACGVTTKDVSNLCGQ